MKPKKYHYLLTVFLVIQILILSNLSSQNEWIENYYSNGIYPVISGFFRILLGWIPFSIGDLLLAYALFVALRFLYRTIKTFKKSWFLRIFQALSFISVLYFCFYLFWGLNYYRESLASNLGYEQRKYSTEELIQLSKYLIKKLNEKHFIINQSDTALIENPYSQRKMYKLARNGYDSLAFNFPQFTYRYGYAKSSLMSLLQSYNGTSGYINPLTGEAHVNCRIPKTSYPTTICHEMSHQIGIAAENEANFVGFLAALYNEDVYFQYAAYRMATRYAIFELYKRDPEEYKLIFATINKGILKDFKASSKFWKQFENPFEPLMKKGYNAYLKVNKQSKGIESYNYVVDLLISYYLDQGIDL